MRLLLLSLAAILQTSAPAAPGGAGGAADRAPSAVETAPVVPLANATGFRRIPDHCGTYPEPISLAPGERPMPKKLTELPPADAYHAVMRQGSDGCLDPVMVGYQWRSR